MENIEALITEKLNSSGLIKYLAKEKSHFLETPEGTIFELVVNDSSKLSEVKKVVEASIDRNSESGTIRALWNVETIGKPLQAYSPETGTPVAGMYYPVDLRSGSSTLRVSVFVTYLAGERFAESGIALERETDLVRDYVASRLRIGGPSYWNPEAQPRLEINSDTARFIMSQSFTKH